ncbi:MAG: NADH-FMN oxidoreductase, partial [uncultured Sphingomonas sp.]
GRTRRAPFRVPHRLRPAHAARCARLLRDGGDGGHLPRPRRPARGPHRQQLHQRVARPAAPAGVRRQARRQRAGADRGQPLRGERAANAPAARLHPLRRQGRGPVRCDSVEPGRMRPARAARVAGRVRMRGPCGARRRRPPHRGRRGAAGELRPHARPAALFPRPLPPLAFRL